MSHIYDDAPMQPNGYLSTSGFPENRQDNDREGVYVQSVNTCTCGLNETARIHWRNHPEYHRFQKVEAERLLTK